MTLAGISVCLANGSNCPSVLGGANISSNGASAGYLSQWQNGSVLNSSVIFQSGSNIGIGMTTQTAKLHVNGSINTTTGNDICIDGGNCLTAINWTALQNYPAACGAGTVITTIGDTITCSGIINSSTSTDTNRIMNTSLTNCTAGNVATAFNSTGGAICSGIINSSTSTDTNRIMNTSLTNCSAGNVVTAHNSTGGVICSAIINTSATGNVNGTGVANYIAMWNGTAWLNSSNIYYLASSAYIGIATTVPTATLQVSGNLSVNGTTNSSFNGNTLFIDASNNRIGIGDASPDALLDVQSNSAANQLRISYDDSNYGNISVNSGGNMTIRASGHVIIDLS
jgi:hypothetical protein